MLPEIRSSSEVYGHLVDGPLTGLPISGVSLNITVLNMPPDFSLLEIYTGRLAYSNSCERKSGVLECQNRSSWDFNNFWVQMNLH